MRTSEKLTSHLERPLARGHTPLDAVTAAAGGAACGDLIRISLAVDPDGASRVAAEDLAFPNGMVDRITPATGAREIDLLRDNFQIEDNWPVYCEEFKQWVLEDKFPLGRPALEKVGVTFVDYDHDGDLDLYVTQVNKTRVGDASVSPHQMWRNNGDVISAAALAYASG